MRQHHMRIQQPSDGDEHVTWEIDDPESVKAAEEKFNQAMGEGKRAYKVEKENKPGEQLNKFDPEIGEILIAAPLSGG